MRIVTLALLLLTACAHKQAKSDTGPPAPPKSLYERLGGLPAISAVIDAFLHNVATDERINARFAAADLPDLRQKLIDQVCQATGGPCTYKGRDMVSAHKGMNIQPAEFDALVGDLQQALTTFKVPEKEQGELLGALGGMRPQIVDNGAGAAPAQPPAPAPGAGR